MNRISAAEQYLIEFDETVWALLSYVESGDTAIDFEARTEEPLSFSPAFASSRRLPATLSLPLDYVWQVVLGWSQDDEAWHLGLLLATDLASIRGSRWCELARWPDPDPEVFSELAQQAAKGLSLVIGCPLNVISADYVLGKRKERPELAPEVSLPDLPLDIGEWTLARNKRGILNLKRNAGWKRGKIVKIAWYIVWLAVYLLLSILTLNSNLALPNAGAMLPNPDILPYLGLVVALILLGLIVYHVYDLMRQPDRIVFDGTHGVVAALRGKKQRWIKPASDLKGVFVTEIVNQRGDKHTVYEQALNLYLKSENFLPIFHQEHQHDVDSVARSSDLPVSEAVIPLGGHEVQTNSQAAGLYITKELDNLTCYYDRRTR